MNTRTSRTQLAAALGLSSVAAQAQVQFAEWLYNTSEFIEFTNLGKPTLLFVAVLCVGQFMWTC